jgi:hypothetical protein
LKIEPDNILRQPAIICYRMCRHGGVFYYGFAQTLMQACLFFKLLRSKFYSFLCYFLFSQWLNSLPEITRYAIKQFNGFGKLFLRDLV